ncbi:MAG: beta-hydroxyacyl-ACP dehydratase [Prevotella sp.]|nr:beta-hydroxyacyl-ACP dehydratase [Prevotella sp.]MBR4276464.1 beta-hydroxyacyl-ACP dehydratase [Prevotella sp.]
MNKMDITQLIPQRSPIVMIDELLCVNGDEAQCQLTVRPDNFFIDEDTLMAEPGLIEHIAQSASAFAGYRAVQAGATEPPVGYIGEVKNFHLYHRPQIGDVLVTTITMGPEVEGITIIRGETKCGDEVVADTTMKIFVKE